MSKKNEITIGSLTTFLEFILNSEKNKEEGFNYYYRGEPRYYELRTPSLYLHENLTLNGSERYYKMLFNELGVDEYIDNSSLVRKLAELQHYGAKTRILDITKNPLVALYFAVEKELDKPGYVYFFREESSYEKFDSGHTVAIKSAINLMPKDTVDKFLTIMPMFRNKINQNFYKNDKLRMLFGDDYFLNFTTEKLTEEIKDLGWEVKHSEGAYYLDDGVGMIIYLEELLDDEEKDLDFWNELYHDEENALSIIADKINNIVVNFMELLNQRAKINEKLQYPLAIYNDMINSHIVNASKNTSRIKQQQGAFIYPKFSCSSKYVEIKNDIHDSIQEKGAKLSTNKTTQQSVEVIKIPAGHKEKIKEQLALIGITDGFIYPDIEHISKALL